MSKHFLLNLVFLILSLNLFSQNGIIRGTVVDDETGEPLFAANIGILGTTIGTAADFDGKFELSASPGTYKITISFIGYNSLELTDVIVKSDEVNLLNDIRLSTNAVSLNTVTISAEVQRNTESALLTVKKRSPILMDAISSQSFKRSADGNAAAAAKRIPGVSIQGGKYVYIRGLGDRYTKTQLNSMDVPGLDPDRNSIQMDIFPTNIIDNIKILKSFSANLPADFTGGVVDIETKSFPDESFSNFSITTNFNLNSSFNNKYLSYQGSSTDFLGFDGGLRDLPVSVNEVTEPIDIIIDFDRMLTINNSFESNLLATKKMSLFDGSFSYSFGNQILLKDNKFGYVGAVSYKNSFDFYDNKIENRWEKSSDQQIFNLVANKKTNGELGKNNISLSLMAGAGLKVNNSSYKVNLLHLQNGETKAGKFFTQNFKSNVNVVKTDVLDYSERSLSNILFEGKHTFNENNIIYNWKVSPTLSKIRDKDVRETPYEVIINNLDTSYIIDPSNASRPTRTWRYLDELNFAISNNLLIKHSLFSRDAKFNAGLYYTYKERDFNVIKYTLNASGIITNDQFTGNPNELLTTLAITNNNSTGFYHSGGEQISNKYNGIQLTVAPYFSEEFFISSKFKSILGLRVEYYNQYYTGENQENEVYNNVRVIDDLGFYPNFNLIYELSKQQKFRTAIFKTTARPSFKEKSLAQIYDAITGTTFNGNINLVPTDINNFDFRYEIYGEKTNSATISLFYKDLKNAIELAKFKSDEDNIQPVNAESSNIKGIEFEFKSEIKFISDLVNSFNLNFNTSFISSRTYIFGDELSSKLDNLRDGESLNDNNDFQERFFNLLGIQDNSEYYRVMQGQAPYLVNVGLSYTNNENYLQCGMYYNVQGKTLSVVSINREPDIYSSPFHSLNLNLSKKFGNKNQIKVNLGAKNILNSKKEMLTDSFKAIDEIYSSYDPGREFFIKLSYNLK